MSNLSSWYYRDTSILIKHRHFKFDTPYFLHKLVFAVVCVAVFSNFVKFNSEQVTYFLKDVVQKFIFFLDFLFEFI